VKIFGNLIKKFDVTMATNKGLSLMDIKRGFVGGFLILGFSIFIVGFIAGILSIMLLQSKWDLTAQGFMVFIFGFLTGALMICLTWTIIKLNELEKESSTEKV
jgi:hypothetical protein